VSLRFPDPVIMPGEPTSFQYVVRNDSDIDYHLHVGSDYRAAGRPTSFTMRAVRKDGDKEIIIYEKFVPFHLGGLGGGMIVPAKGGEYVFDLEPRAWFDLKEPGEYRIDVARKLVSEHNSFARVDAIYKGDPLPDEFPTVLRVASGTLTIRTLDEAALGEFIETWGKRATAEIKPRGNNEQDWEEHDKALAERDRAIGKIGFVKDDRAIPWLIKVEAYYALAKYNNDEVLAFIAKGMDYKDKDNSAKLPRQQQAAFALARSEHPEAIKILQKYHNHPECRIRQAVIRAAEKMDREFALAMLREHFDDPGGHVATIYQDIAKEAKEMYKKLTEEEAK
jgi:hypothetical protein